MWYHSWGQVTPNRSTSVTPIRSSPAGRPCSARLGPLIPSASSPVLDIELPRMNGVEFLSWALARDPELAVIMLTGLDNPDLALECLSKGARTYFVKPFDPSFIEQALRDAVAMRRLLVERNAVVAPSERADGPGS